MAEPQMLQLNFLGFSAVANGNMAILAVVLLAMVFLYTRLRR